MAEQGEGCTGESEHVEATQNKNCFIISLLLYLWAFILGRRAICRQQTLSTEVMFKHRTKTIHTLAKGSRGTIVNYYSCVIFALVEIIKVPFRE